MRIQKKRRRGSIENEEQSSYEYELAAGLLSNFGATFYLPQLVVVISLRKYTERLWEWLVLESLLRNHASNARRAEAYDGHLDEAERKNDGLA